MLPEIWGLASMTEETKAMLLPPPGRRLEEDCPEEPGGAPMPPSPPPSTTPPSPPYWASLVISLKQRNLDVVFDAALNVSTPGPVR